LDALAAMGGGILNVPAGRYVVASPVLKNFSSRSSYLTIRGVASDTPIDVNPNGTGLDLSSELIIKVGADADAFSLIGLEFLLVKDIQFKGVETALNDTRNTLVISGVDDATINHCEFYGLSNLWGGAIIYAFDSNLRVQESAFLGCSTNSAFQASVIQNKQWRGLSVSDSKFIDYGVGDFYSKTPLASPYSWVGFSYAAPPGVGPLRRYAFLHNLFMDEGAYYSIANALPYGIRTPADLVQISDVRINTSSLGVWGIYIDGARDVIIENSFLGHSRLASGAIALTSVQNAVVSNVFCDPDSAAKGIYADVATVSLKVVNSVCLTSQSSAQSTKVLPPKIVTQP
jgi:hypothetical protein